MAKENKRGNREVKKPKQVKTAAAATAQTFGSRSIPAQQIGKKK